MFAFVSSFLLPSALMFTHVNSGDQIQQHCLQAWPQSHHLKTHNVTPSASDFEVWEVGGREDVAKRQVKPHRNFCLFAMWQNIIQLNFKSVHRELPCVLYQ